VVRPPVGAHAVTRAAGTLLSWLAILALGVSLAEGGLRLAGHAPGRVGGADRALWQYQPRLGWINAPGATGQDFRGGPDLGSVRINSLGLRGPELAPGKPAGVRRVVVLGDSFAFGVGVDEQHVVSARLQAILNGDHDLAEQARFEVVNLGVSGYSTDQELLLFEELAPRLQPDIVIVLMCDNDFEGNTLDFVYGRYYKPYFEASPVLRLLGVPVPRAQDRRPVRSWLLDHSALLTDFEHGRRGGPFVARLRAGLAYGTPVPRESDAQGLMVALLQRLRQDADRAGASLALFNTGHVGERTPLFQALRPRLAALGFFQLGLEDALGRARKRDPSLPWDFGSDTHWNVASHALAAQVIHDYLRLLVREGDVASLPQGRRG
jgi:lysophospholipase L1-like esterase